MANARRSASAPGRATLTSSTSARSFPLRSRAPCRCASSCTTSAPTLWRVPSYSDPGVPSPTTSRSAGVPVRAARRSIRALLLAFLGRRRRRLGRALDRFAFLALDRLDLRLLLDAMHGDVSHDRVFLLEDDDALRHREVANVDRVANHQ